MQQHCRIKLGNFISPPETKLWSCVSVVDIVLVYFSETSHVTVISLDVLYIFRLFVIKQHLRKMLWVFKFKYDSVMKQDIISYMFTVEDTRTKSMFIMHFGRQQLNREIHYISVCL